MPDLASEASAQLDQLDLTVMILIENFNNYGVVRANALSIMSHIGGAGARDVDALLSKLKRLKVIEDHHEFKDDVVITDLGNEVLVRDVQGWQPGTREIARRDVLRTLRLEAASRN